MKKTLLTLLSLALTMGINAQSEEATSQRIVGYYTSDDYDETFGTGLPDYGENDNCKAAIDLTEDILEHYDGAKVTAIRFALTNNLEKSRVFIAGVSDDGVVGEDLVSVDVPTTQTGWNTIPLPEPFTISKDQEIMAGYVFKQKTTQDIYGEYSEECYPISCSYNGRTDKPLLIFANIPASWGGKGEAWYNFGAGHGNLSIQLVVEGNFADCEMTPKDFGPITAEQGKDIDISFELFNNSSSSVSDFNYILTIDGVAQQEKVGSFTTPLPSGQRSFLNKTIPAFTEPGTHEVTLEIKKADSKENQAAKRIAKGEIIVSTAGIDEVSSGSSSEAQHYTIDGVKLSATKKGLNIVKMSDGSTVKVMVK